MWARIGKQIDIPYQNYHRSIKYFGALGTNSRMFVREYHSFTAEYFIECLSEMFKKYGRFVILVDGASSHHAESVKEFCDEKGIKLIFLPVGRPELSAIEKIWLDLKKELVYRHFYENSNEFKIKAACFFRRKFTQYGLMEYLQKDVVA